MVKDFSIFDWTKNEIVFVGAVLVAIVVISTNQLLTSQMRTRDAQRRADTELVARAIGAYFEDYKTLPLSENGKIVACGDKGLSICEWGQGQIVDKDNVTYLKKLPEDPWKYKGYKYVYEVDEKNQTFRVYAFLENLSDKTRKAHLTVQCGNNVQCSWYAPN